MKAEEQATSMEDLAKSAKQASAVLAASSNERRNDALAQIAKNLEQSQEQLFKSNAIDLQNAQAMLEKGELSKTSYDRLKFDAAKLRDTISGINQLRSMPDPLGKTEFARELDHGLILEKITCPLGLIAVIFESRPDVLPQIAALAVKSGNAVILKGGREAEQTNRALCTTIRAAIEKAGLPAQCIELVSTRQEVNELLKLNHLIDLVIPRGSNDLVRYVQSNTRIPVLGHAEGICHLYIDKEADLDMAIKIAIDAKTQYPSACNAIETILIHENVAGRIADRLIDELIENQVQVRVDPSMRRFVSSAAAAADSAANRVIDATAEDWHSEYCDLVVSVKTVQSLQHAIEHINQHGSGHTETMVSTNKARFEMFFSMVNSAGVYWNASTRFADGFRYGFGAEVGISTNTIHPRGPVGLEGLVTYKYKLTGQGHIVADYTGTNGRKFTHKEL